MSEWTPGDMAKIATELSRTTNISPAEAFQMVAKECQMAEELERANDLIATYERDRTKHLRSIEGADTDLAELGESLGREIERLEDSRELERATRREVEAENVRLREEISGLMGLMGTASQQLREAKAQRDELLNETKNAKVVLETLADTMDSWATESRAGGWSTHQIHANRDEADNCRRYAASCRAAIAKATP